MTEQEELEYYTGFVANEDIIVAYDNIIITKFMMLKLDKILQEELFVELESFISDLKENQYLNYLSYSQTLWYNFQHTQTRGISTMNTEVIKSIASLLYKMATADEIVKKIEQRSIYEQMKNIIKEFKIDISQISEDELLMSFVQDMKSNYKESQTYIINNLDDKQKLILLDKMSEVAISDGMLHEDEKNFAKIFASFTWSGNLN